MKKESEAIKKLCSHKSNVSSHYFIKKNGQLLNLVPDLYTAWHAGKSNWKKSSSLNKCSIGIEISNPGHDYGYKNFSPGSFFLKGAISEWPKIFCFLIEYFFINDFVILIKHFNCFLLKAS